MDKYQEDFDKIATYINNDTLILFDELKSLQKLVDKETPMKVNFTYAPGDVYKIKHGLCKCGRTIGKGKGWSYCPQCGQRINQRGR